MADLKSNFKIVFLDTDTYGEVFEISALQTLGTASAFANTSTEETLSRCKNADIIISNKVVLNADIISKCHSLKLICVAATGTNNVDIEFAKNKNIEVKNIVDYSTNSVAQITFGLILQLLNNISYHDDYVKNGGYTKSPNFTHLGKPFSELSSKKMGIIGMGNIGRKVAEIAEAFGAKVTYHSISGKPRTEKYTHVGFEELISTSDIISIHSPLNDKTKNLITLKELSNMKPSTLLINAGRGGIVSEQDLAYAIDHNLIAGAGVDVFSQEPIKKDNPLLKIKNKNKIALCPHIAWASVEARKLALKKVYQNISDFIQQNK